MKGYILITARNERALPGLRQELYKSKGKFFDGTNVRLDDVQELFGQYDLILAVTYAKEKDLRSCESDVVKAKKGVKETKTLVGCHGPE